MCVRVCMRACMYNEIVRRVTLCRHSSCRAQWLRGRASYFRLREPGFESSAGGGNLGQGFSL